MGKNKSANISGQIEEVHSIKKDDIFNDPISKARDNVNSENREASFKQDTLSQNTSSNKLKPNQNTNKFEPSSKNTSLNTRHSDSVKEKVDRQKASKDDKTSTELEKNRSKDVDDRAGIDSNSNSSASSFKNINYNKAKAASKPSSMISNLSSPIRDRLSKSNRLNSLKDKAKKIKDSPKRESEKIVKSVKKLITTVKAIFHLILHLWLPILVIVFSLYVVLPVTQVILWSIGNNPHYYCAMEAPAAIKNSSVYKQYCGVSSGGNESIADAAVSLAYELENLDQVEHAFVAEYCSSKVSHSSRDKTGGAAPNDIANKLYVDVHDAVLKGDGYYASCDRSAATAVRWAGADDNFPAGPCGEIITHLENNSDKWEKVGALSSENQLEPGDIVISPEHVGIFVGEEAVKKVYPNSDCNVYQGSLDDHCPQLGVLGYWLNGGYTIYRNIQPESASVYKDLTF